MFKVGFGKYLFISGWLLSEADGSQIRFINGTSQVSFGLAAYAQSRSKTSEELIYWNNLETLKPESQHCPFSLFFKITVCKAKLTI